jgi:hypothetical protein
VQSNTARGEIHHMDGTPDLSGRKRRIRSCRINQAFWGLCLDAPGAPTRAEWKLWYCVQGVSFEWGAA